MEGDPLKLLTCTECRIQSKQCRRSTSCIPLLRHDLASTPLTLKHFSNLKVKRQGMVEFARNSQKPMGSNHGGLYRM
ncbi:hypothetical protein RRG08_044366 [Elysia crispata]|uniref:Uncharacterized protein n=1 Tax=Elysia crispata TaxID=231223 RepID=A0AAE1DUA9_9GAST|nr:hypothetical protein RRG08_044366 [Elysia crispata]